MDVSKKQRERGEKCEGEDDPQSCLRTLFCEDGGEGDMVWERKESSTERSRTSYDTGPTRSLTGVQVVQYNQARALRFLAPEKRGRGICDQKQSEHTLQHSDAQCCVWLQGTRCWAAAKHTRRRAAGKKSFGSCRKWMIRSTEVWLGVYPCSTAF